MYFSCIYILFNLYYFAQFLITGNNKHDWFWKMSHPLMTLKSMDIPNLFIFNKFNKLFNIIIII